MQGRHTPPNGTNGPISVASPARERLLLSSDVSPLSRRTFLRSSSALIAGAALAGLPGLSRAAQDVPWTPIGFTQGGLPMVVHHVGDGPRRLFIMGGQHGGPEVNTVQLAQRLLDSYAADPTQLPPGFGLDVMPMVNPDGVAINSRQLLSGVDPNRNWDTPDWSSDAWDSNARLRVGLGGPAPMSEQETRHLADWLLAQRPAFVINYHSQGGFMFGGREGLEGQATLAYADASGYFYQRPAPPSESPTPRPASTLLGYRASGTTNPWMRANGIPNIFIELSTSSAVELDRNLAGVRALLEVLATG